MCKCQKSTMFKQHYGPAWPEVRWAVAGVWTNSTQSSRSSSEPHCTDTRTAPAQCKLISNKYLAMTAFAIDRLIDEWIGTKCICDSAELWLRVSIGIVQNPSRWTIWSRRNTHKITQPCWMYCSWSQCGKYIGEPFNCNLIITIPVAYQKGIVQYLVRKTDKVITSDKQIALTTPTNSNANSSKPSNRWRKMY